MYLNLGDKNQWTRCSSLDFARVLEKKSGKGKSKDTYLFGTWLEDHDSSAESGLQELSCLHGSYRRTQSIIWQVHFEVKVSMEE
jgi:hypothetical protein